MESAPSLPVCGEYTGLCFWWMVLFNVTVKRSPTEFATEWNPMKSASLEFWSYSCSFCLLLIFFSLFSRALLTLLSFYSLLILPWDENRYANRFRLQCVCKILFKWGWITSWSWAVGILDAGTAPSFCCWAKKLLPIVSPHSEGFVMGMIFDPCTPTLCKWVYKRGGVWYNCFHKEFVLCLRFELLIYFFVVGLNTRRQWE